MILSSVFSHFQSIIALIFLFVNIILSNYNKFLPCFMILTAFYTHAARTPDAGRFSSLHAASENSFAFSEQTC